MRIAESKRRELARFGSDGDIVYYNPKFARDIDDAQKSESFDF